MEAYNHGNIRNANGMELKRKGLPRSSVQFSNDPDSACVLCKDFNSLGSAVCGQCKLLKGTQDGRKANRLAKGKGEGKGKTEFCECKCKCRVNNTAELPLAQVPKDVEEDLVTFHEERRINHVFHRKLRSLATGLLTARGDILQKYRLEKAREENDVEQKLTQVLQWGKTKWSGTPPRWVEDQEEEDGLAHFQAVEAFLEETGLFTDDEIEGLGELYDDDEWDDDTEEHFTELIDELRQAPQRQRQRMQYQLDALYVSVRKLRLEALLLAGAPHPTVSFPIPDKPFTNVEQIKQFVETLGADLPDDDLVREALKAKFPQNQALVVDYDFVRLLKVYHKAIGETVDEEEFPGEDGEDVDDASFHVEWSFVLKRMGISIQ